MRIRGYDEETSELSEDLKNISGDIADLTKSAEHPIGVSLFTDDTKTTYKSTYQILKDISEIYDELTDKQQAELLEKLAGKRGAQTLAGLLKDFSSVEKAMNTMQNAAGSADREMGVIRDSIDYKLNNLKQTWVGIAQDLIQRDDFGKIVSGLTNVSTTLDGLISKKDSLVGLGTIIGGISGAILGVKGAGLVNVVQKPTNENPNALGIGNYGITNPLLGRENTADLQIFNKLIPDLQAGALNAEKLEQAMEGMTETNKRYVRALIQTDAELVKNGQVSKIATQSANQLSKGFQTQAIAARMATVRQIAWNVALNIGIGLLVGAGINLISKLASAEQDYADKLKQSTSEFNEHTKSIQDYKTQIEDLRKKLSDSNTSYEDAKTYRQQLYDIQTELINQYGDEEEKIKAVTDAINGQVGALDKLIKKEWEKVKLDLENPNIFEKVSGFIRGTGSGLTSIKNLFENPAEYFTDTIISKNIMDELGELKSAEDLYDKLIAKRDEFEEGSLQYKAYSRDAKKVRDEIDKYQESYKAYLSMEVIPDDKDLSNYDSQLKTLYDKYKDVRIKDGEEAAETYKKQLITVFNDIQSDSSVSDNVKDYWSDVYAEIIPSANEQRFKDDFNYALNTLYEDIEVPVEDTDIPVEPNFYIKDPEEQKEKLKEELEKIAEGGNVDLTNRTKISTSMLKDAGYEDVGEGYATTYTQTFSNEDETMAINVTPIFTNPETGQTEVLTEDELIDYAESLLRGDINDYLNLQIGATFTGEDAVQQADEAAKYAHEVQEQYYSDNPLEVDAAIKFEDADAQEYYNLLKKYEDRLNQKGHVFGDNIIYNSVSEKDSIKDYQRIMQLEKKLAAKGYTGDEFVLPSMQKIGSNETQIKRQVTTVQDKIKEIIKQSGFNFWEDLLASGENNDYYKQIQDILDKYELAIEDVIPSIADKIGLKSKTSYETEKNLAKSVERFKVQAAGVTDSDQSRDYQDLIKLTSSLTEEQKYMFVQVTKGAQSALEAMDMWKESLNGVEDKVEELSDTDFISNINSDLPDLDKIKSIYDDVKDKGDFDYTATTNDDFKEKFSQYTKEYEDFVTTVTKNPDNIKATQDAFDNLVDAWVRGSGVLDSLTEDNKQYAIKELTDNGIVNAKEVVNKYLEQQNAAAKYKEELKQLAPELAKYKNNLAALAGKKASGGKSENVLNTKEVKEYNKEIKKTQGYLTKLTGVDISKELTEQFAQSADNLDDLQAALEGSETAIERVKTALATDMVISINADIDTNHANEVISSFVSYVQSIDPELIGTAEFNINPAVQALNTLLAQTGATASQIEAIYGSLGVDATVTGFKTIRVPDLSTKREEINDGITSYRYDYKEVQFPTIEYKKKDGSSLGSHYVSPTKNTGSGGSGGGGGGGGGGSSKSDPTKTSFDWIERRIKKLTDAIDDFNKKVSNTWLSWKTRNTELGKSIKENEKLLKSYTKSEKSYQRAMNNIAKGKNAEGGNNKEWDNYTGKKASKKQKAKWEKYTKWIKEGRITMSKEGDLKLITDKEGKDFAGQLQAWQDYWDKKVEAEKNAYDTMLTIQEQYEERFNSIQEHYDTLREERNAKFAKKTAIYDRANLIGIPSEEEINKYFDAKEASDSKIVEYDKKEVSKLQKDLDKIDKSFDKETEKSKKKRDKAKETEAKAKTKAKNAKKKKGKNSEEYKKAKAELEESTKARKQAEKDYKKTKKDNNKAEKEWLKSDERKVLKTEIANAETQLEEDKTQQMYQNALDRFQAFVDRINRIHELAILAPSHNMEMVEAYMGLAEAQGKILSKEFYKLQDEQNDALRKENATHTKELKDALDAAILANNGKFDLTNQEMLDTYTQLNEAEREGVELETQHYELLEKQKQAALDIYNLKQSYISDLKSETDFLRNILSIEHDLFDVSIGNEINSGRFNEYGNATLGLYAVDYETAKQQAMLAKQEYETFKASADMANQKDVEKLKELNEQWRQHNLNMENAKKAIVDLYKQQYQEILKSLQKIINKRKEALQLEKNEYEYSKKIRNQTRDVNVLRKQLAAMSGDETEENRAKLQRLQVQLKEAEETLEESEYDKWVSDTNEMLDDLYNEFSDLYERLGKDIDGRLQETITAFNNGSLDVSKTISTEMDELGGTVSSELQLITSGQTTLNNAVTTYTLIMGNKVDNLISTLTGDAENSINTTYKNLNAWLKDPTVRAKIEGNADVSLNDDKYKTIPDTATTTSTSGNVTTQTTTNVKTGETSTSYKVGNVSTNDKSIAEQYWFHGIFGSNKKGKGLAQGILNQYKTGKVTSSSLGILLNNLLKNTYGVTKWDYPDVKLRSSIYSQLGFIDKYIGSAGQEKRILEELAKHGYATGGSVAGTFRKATGEDGIALVRKGEYILTPEMLKDALAVVNPLAELSNSLGGAKADNLRTKIEMGDVNFSVTLPNVKNYDEFKSSLIADKQFEKVIQEVSIGRSLGNNSLKKYSIR